MIPKFFRRSKAAVPQQTKSVMPLIALAMTGAPQWGGRDYASLSQTGILRNAIVHRCIRMVAEAAASVPWILYDGETELETHPLLDVLRCPNPYEDGTSLFMRWYAHMISAGNSYLRAGCVGRGVRELYVLQPDRVQAVVDSCGWPVAYDYSGGGRTVRVTRDGDTGFLPILHCKLFHPLDDVYGLSPLEAAGISIDIHNAGAGWTKSLLDNAARPSGALVYKGGDGYSSLTDDQFQRLKSELENTYQGACNAGRPMILEGGLEWRSMSYSPSDMNFIEIRNAAAREIAMVFGVPPMLLGIPGDSTYANYREANLNFWRQTVLPLVARTADALSTWFAAACGSRLRIVGNTDAIEALAEERQSEWQRIDAASFLTRDEKRAAAGYSPEKTQEGYDEHIG